MSKEKSDYKVRVEFKENGKKRSKTLSLEKYNETKEDLLNENTLVSLEYKLNGELHRKDGPAVISYNDDGSVDREEWYLNGQQHREDGPAVIDYDDDGNVSYERWYLNGQGLNIVEFAKYLGVDHYKSKLNEVYLKDGKKHREDAPAVIEYNDDGSISYEEWYLNGKKHREDAPAEIWYNDDGSVYRESWYLNGNEIPKEVILNKLNYHKSEKQEVYLKDGNLHKEDGPAYIECNDNGTVWREYWYFNGKLHREGRPAVIEYNDDGSISYEEWYLNGQQHREDGPAYVEYEDGSVSSEAWYLNGEKHREDFPAVISYYEDGSVWYEMWYLNGDKHREDGPAKIWYNDDGSVYRESWYLNGKSLEIEEVANHLKVDHFKSETVEVYLKDAELHREDGPAKIYYRDERC